MNHAIMRKPTTEEVKTLARRNKVIDRKRWNGEPITPEDLEAELRYARLYCQARANEDGVAWHLGRYPGGLTWGLCDWDLEFKDKAGMAIPEILETYTPMTSGSWLCSGLGAV